MCMRWRTEECVEQAQTKKQNGEGAEPGRRGEYKRKKEKKKEKELEKKKRKQGHSW